jgi:plastin-1
MLWLVSISSGANEERALLARSYAVSVARKLGALLFLLPEDLVEVRPKMVLSFVASLFAVDVRAGPSMSV